MFYCIDIYNKHCLSLQKLKNDNTQHTHPLKFFILVIVHTLDFWYMISSCSSDRLFIFYHILKIYSWPTTKIKILRQQHSIVCKFSTAGFFEFLQ